MEEQLAGAKWSIVGEYASYADASRNFAAIVGPVREVCVDADAPYRNLTDF